MPAEFSAHERTVLCWPARDDLYGDRLAEAEAAHSAVAQAISVFEPVTIIADHRHVERAASVEGANITVLELPIDDSWFRDSGPTYVYAADDSRVAVSFEFNGWGNKFTPYDNDARVASAWAQHNGDPVRHVSMVLEGGSINSDGNGTLVTTMQCLLHPNRNPQMSQAQITQQLHDELGAESVVWLPHGLVLDHDTDGHVDNVAAFAPNGHLLMQGCSDTSEDDWARLEINRKVAMSSVDSAGNTLQVVDIPVLPFVEADGRRLVVPYLNFYVGNGFVLVPTCGNDADDDILQLIGEQFVVMKIMEGMQFVYRYLPQIECMPNEKNSRIYSLY
jgi:agmatine deiminase